MPPADRERFVRSEAGADTELSRAVLRLLEHDAADQLLDRSVDAIAAALLDPVDTEEAILARGDRVGDYEILGILGRGGMGVVYQARDTRLDRLAALKFLPPGADQSVAARVEAEARAASALDHPNIATIYHVGTATDGRPYLAMAHYEGQTLADRLQAGPFDPGEAVRIATAVTAGLAAAHQRGIVHRDVKPANVFLTADGQPKLIDFGIATITRDDPAALGGATRGTAAYLSPECARGEPAGPPADVWALGVMLWEMLVGHRPFDGRTVPALLAQVTSPEPVASPPPRLPVSRELRRVLRRALEKNPLDRYSDGGALLLALQRSAATRVRIRRIGAMTVAGVLVVAAFAVGVLTSSPTIPDGVVVLPFDNLSGDSTTSYLAEGVADGLIADLGVFPALRVIARTSAFRSRSTRKSLAQMAAELDVETAIEGSVSNEAGRFRLSLRLVEATTGRVVWAQSLTAASEDLPALRGRLARELAGELGLTPPTSLRRRLEQTGAVDPRAYASYLRGRFHSNRRTGEDLRRAQTAFDEALDLDPAFSDAWTGLAGTLFLLPQYSELKPQAVMPQALRAARRAITLDSTAGEAYSVLGGIFDTYQYDHAAARTAHRRAVDLAPGNATALHFLALHLCSVGRFPEARALYRQALRVDPVSPIITMAAGLPDLYARDFPAALRQFAHALELDSTFALAHAAMGRAYLGLGRLPEAIHALEQSRPREAAFGYLGFAYARSGRRQDALALAEEWRDADLLYLAFIQLGLHERGRALDLLERAVDARSVSLQFAAVQPMLDELRSEPRFRTLLARMGY